MLLEHSEHILQLLAFYVWVGSAVQNSEWPIIMSFVVWSQLAKFRLIVYVNFF